jgi:hypothetical protein
MARSGPISRRSGSRSSKRRSRRFRSFPFTGG